MQQNGNDKQQTHCPFWDEWKEHKHRALETVGRVEAIEATLVRVAENLNHLATLPAILDRLVESATGRDHVPTRVLLVIVGTMGTVILGLVFTIVFLLTGENVGWINQLHR